MVSALGGLSVVTQEFRSEFNFDHIPCPQVQPKPAGEELRCQRGNRCVHVSDIPADIDFQFCPLQSGKSNAGHRSMRHNNFRVAN
jgi:hypothetical protein